MNHAFSRLAKALVFFLKELMTVISLIDKPLILMPQVEQNSLSNSFLCPWAQIHNSFSLENMPVFPFSFLPMSGKESSFSHIISIFLKSSVE